MRVIELHRLHIGNMAHEQSLLMYRLFWLKPTAKIYGLFCLKLTTKKDNNKDPKMCAVALDDFPSQAL